MCLSISRRRWEPFELAKTRSAVKVVDETLREGAAQPNAEYRVREHLIEGEIDAEGQSSWSSGLAGWAHDLPAWLAGE